MSLGPIEGFKVLTGLIRPNSVTISHTNKLKHSRVHVFLHAAASDAAAKLDFVHSARDRDDFLEQIKHVLELRQWERTPPLPAPSTASPAGGQQQPGQPGQPSANPGTPGGGEAPAFTTRTAGVGGIIRRQEHARAAQDKLAMEAFADLTTLMGKARDVVGVIERYATVLAAKQAEAQGQGGGNGDDAESAELEGLLRDMGIMSNPVTRSSAGSLYHQELARQLAEFLRKGKGQGADLKGRGGMLTLHDAFCLFNRCALTSVNDRSCAWRVLLTQYTTIHGNGSARGTALISPEDLLDACNLLEPLHLGMRLRRFPSGVNVIEAGAWTIPCHAM